MRVSTIPCRLLIALATALASACSTGDPVVFTSSPVTIDEIVHPGAGDALFLGAGDIARCSEIEGALATGHLIRTLLGKFPDARVFTAGDNAYEHGTAAEFRDCYEPAWGSFNDRTAPSPGNHDYYMEGAQPYFAYFDQYRRDPAARVRGYYSFDVKDWHVVSLNSDIPMDAASPQVEWLQSDLESTQKPCILAVWHHPLFSSGDEHGADPRDPGRFTADLWKTLERHHADVILNGHDHDYERFAPQDHRGTPTPEGPRQFVVGTGGAEIRGFGPIRPNSEHRELRHGALVLTLGPGAYSWAFLGTDGKAYDHSVAVVACHAGASR